jgi:hypothetical protein
MATRIGSWRKVAILGGILALCLTGCSAKEPASISLSGIVYNYSQDSLATVKINGKTAGTAMGKVVPGDVSGGGVMCCFKLPENAKEVEVEIQSSSGDYKTTAQIEKWWPDLAHYGVVHVLPGRKVVMQVTPSAPSPRKDLLEAQQRALGMEVKTLFKIWDGGPIERIDGKGK